MPSARPGSFIPPEALADGPTLAAAAAQAVALARAGDSRQGLALALRARHQAQGLEIETGELAALNAAGIVHAIRGDFIAAVAAGIDTYVLARRQGDRSVMGHALVTLSSAAFALGALGQARSVLARCIEAAIESADMPLEIRARIGLGVVLGDCGDFDEAAREFARSLFLVRQHRDTTAPSRIIANLANVHCKRGRRLLAAGEGAQAMHEFAEADQLARRALSAATDEVNLPVQIDATAIRGRAQHLQGARLVARDLLARSAAIGRSARCRTPLPWVLCELGRVQLALAEIDAARRTYEEALEAAIELQPSTKIEEACIGLAEVERLAGDQVGSRRWRDRAACEAADFERARHHTRLQLETFFANK